MNFQVGPGGQILNITRDVEQNCDFPGSPRGTVFFCAGRSREVSGGPGTPGYTQAELAGFRQCFATRRRFAFESLRFRIASLRRFAFESLRWIRFASNRFAFESLRFESLRFRIASLLNASLSNRFALNRFAFEFGIPTRRRVGGLKTWKQKWFVSDFVSSRIRNCTYNILYYIIWYYMII